MVEALQKPGLHASIKRYVLNDNEKGNDKTLTEFVSSSSLSFFTNLALPCTLLKEHPSKWNDLEDYKRVKKFVNSMQVVNDNVERSVSLIKEYNAHLTKNKEQLQYLLQVVESHREKFPKGTKSELKKN